MDHAIEQLSELSDCPYSPNYCYYLRVYWFIQMGIAILDCDLGCGLCEHIRQFWTDINVLKKLGAHPNYTDNLIMNVQYLQSLCSV